MKKNFFVGFIALTALTVTSCSNDDVVMQSPEVNKAIEFGTYVGRDAVSRASVHTMSTLAGEDGPGFGVFAYYTDEGGYATTTSPCNFMYNQQVKITETTDGNNTTYACSYTPIKYWPNDPGDKLTFFAYAPYDAPTSDTDNNGNISFVTQANMAGDPIITFNVNNTVKNQTDLLISKSNNIDLVKNGSNTNNVNVNDNDGIHVTEKVNFQFAHALARIGFTVKAIVDEQPAVGTEKLNTATTIVLKEVILSGAAHNPAKDDVFQAPSEGIFYTQGKLNLNQQATNNQGNYIWTDIVGDGVDEDNVQNPKQIFTLNNGNFETQTKGTEETNYFGMFDAEGFILTEDTKILNTANSTTANKLNADDSYIMIIPQDLSSAGFYVYVEYDVITIDQNIGNNSNTYDGLKSKVTNHISTQVTGINFQSGKAYTLNLQLGMTSVKVTADVDAWSEQTGTSVDLPQNTQQNP